MSNAHTPGPWRAKTSRVIVAPRSRTNVHGETNHYEAELAWTQPVPEREGGEKTRLANARLIAAAPDLLAALQKARAALALVEHWDAGTGGAHPDIHNGALDDAADAIAKATGEEPTA